MEKRILSRIAMRHVCAAISWMALASAANPAAAADLAALSNGQASAGLKKALDQGINHAVGKLGVPGGFLDNPAVKIPLPPALEKGEKVMRMMGLGSQADELTVAMNRAAEAAVPESKPILEHALTHMTMDDAKQILTGGDDAATQYFKKATNPALEAKFKPVIEQTTRKVHLAERYDAIASKGAELGLLKPGDASLETYVTQKTLDGLFLMMADEERAIRKDPLGQASNLLKQVFGAIR